MKSLKIHYGRYFNKVFWAIDILLLFVGLALVHHYIFILEIVSIMAVIYSIYTISVARRSLLQGIVRNYSLKDDYDELKNLYHVYFRGLVARYYFTLMTVVGIEISGMGFLYSMANLFYQYLLVIFVIALISISIYLSVFIVTSDCFNIIFKLFNYDLFYTKLHNKSDLIKAKLNKSTN